MTHSRVDGLGDYVLLSNSTARRAATRFLGMQKPSGEVTGMVDRGDQEPVLARCSARLNEKNRAQP